MAIPLPNPAALAFTGTKLLTGKREPRELNPLNDSAIRASLLSQGLGEESGNIPGSNVPGVRVTGQPNIPTRNAIGIGGDAAFNATASIFRQQLAKQLAGQITNLNREFSTAGRFNSGQRLEAISRSQEQARGAFGQFLSQTALERFLAEQRNQTQLEAARIGAGAGTPGRAEQVGGILGNIGQIFATNPEFFIDLFRGGGGGGVSSGNANLTRSFANLKG